MTINSETTSLVVENLMCTAERLRREASNESWLAMARSRAMPEAVTIRWLICEQELYANYHKYQQIDCQLPKRASSFRCGCMQRLILIPLARCVSFGRPMPNEKQLRGLTHMQSPGDKIILGVLIRCDSDEVHVATDCCCVGLDCGLMGGVGCRTGHALLYVFFCFLGARPCAKRGRLNSAIDGHGLRYSLPEVLNAFKTHAASVWWTHWSQRTQVSLAQNHSYELMNSVEKWKWPGYMKVELNNMPSHTSGCKMLFS